MNSLPGLGGEFLAHPRLAVLCCLDWLDMHRLATRIEVRNFSGVGRTFLGSPDALGEIIAGGFSDRWVGACA
jgi:hypothetical protein